MVFLSPHMYAGKRGKKIANFPEKRTFMEETFFAMTHFLSIWRLMFNCVKNKNPSKNGKMSSHDNIKCHFPFFPSFSEEQRRETANFMARQNLHSQHAANIRSQLKNSIFFPNCFFLLSWNNKLDSQLTNQLPSGQKHDKGIYLAS